MEVVRRGAEAVIYRSGDRIVKERVKKGYRHPDLDVKIRKERTRREARLLTKARSIGVKVPRVLYVDEDRYTIALEYIEGISLKEYLARERKPDIMYNLGQIVGVLHGNHIVHGDLTTSNVIVTNDGLYLIDFGLGEVSRRIEDKAVDLVCFEKSYYATHSDLPEGWDLFLSGYRDTYKEWREVFRRVEVVKRRARYL